MTKPNILSGWADFEKGKNNNSDIIMPKPEWFIEILAVAYKDEKILKHIRKWIKMKGLLQKDLKIMTSPRL